MARKGKSTEEIIECDFRIVLGSKPRQAVAASADTVPAAHPQDNEGIEGQPVARHGARLASIEQKGNSIRVHLKIATPETT